MEHKLPFEKKEIKIIVKCDDAKTDETLGKEPSKRSVKELLDYGVINVDKPSGPTSHQVSDYLKKILKLKKAGHSGTLDPKVTGVLPTALNEATKIIGTLQKAGKEYIAIMHLHDHVSDKQLQKAFKKFTGKIPQLPPIKSAVKRQLRYRSIYYIEVLERDEQDVLFIVGCEAGTYIRKLIHDIGQFLGCGAHMAKLRRTRAGPFDESTLYTLQDIADAFHYYNEGDETHLKKIIIPLEKAITHLPMIWIHDSAINALCNGINLKRPGVVKFTSDIEKDQLVCLMSLKGELVCLARAKMSAKELKVDDKGVAADTERVVMKPNVYPRPQ